MPDSAADGAFSGATSQAASGAHSAAGVTGAQSGAADWAGELTDRAISAVDKLRGRATRPLVGVIRALVYGVILLAALGAAVVFAIIAVVRIWDAYLPLAPLGRRVWLGYMVIGGLVFLSGAGLLLRQRRKTH